MVNINGNANDPKTLGEALKGDYGYSRLSNGIECYYLGRFVYFEGYFNGSQDVIEIPKIPKRVVVHFAGDSFSCISIAEANAGFVSVPSDAKGKKFVVMANCGLNK